METNRYAGVVLRTRGLVEITPDVHDALLQAANDAATVGKQYQPIERGTISMTIMEWSDPPTREKQSRTGRHALAIAAVTQNPGAWGKVTTAKPNGLYHALRRIVGTDWKAKGYSVATGETGNEGTWLRYDVPSQNGGTPSETSEPSQTLGSDAF